MRRITLPCVVGLLVMAAQPALAQESQPRGQRPYRGLFGGGVGNAEQLLTFTLSGGGGYDTNVLAGVVGPGGAFTNTANRRRGPFGLASTGLNYSYSFARTRVGFSGSANASATYNSIVGRWINGEAAGVGAYFQLSKKTRLTVDQSQSYQPNYSLLPAPEPIDPVGPSTVAAEGGRVLADAHWTSATTATLNHELSRRTSLLFGYSYLRSTSASQRLGYTGHAATAGLRIALTKNLALRTGIRFDDTTAGRNETRHYRSYAADIGLDFGRALSLTRRLTLDFGTGTAAIKQRGRTQYYVTGRAVLTREIGRSWQARLGYFRDVKFVEFFGEPVITDSLTPTFVGSVSRRVNFNFGIGASVNQIGVNGTNRYRMYYATTGLSFGLSRNLALSADYAYDLYDFDGAVAPALGFEPRFDRQSIRVFLSLWEPLFQRTRRANASR